MKALLSEMENYGIPNSETTSLIVISAIIILTAVIVHVILHSIVLKTIEKKAQTSTSLWLQIFTQNKLFHRLAFLIQGLIVNMQAVLWFKAGSDELAIVSVCAQLWVLCYILLSMFSILDVIASLSNRYAFARNIPLRGIFQSIKLLGSVVIGIMMISLLIGKSPTILISGLGAMAAVLMLVFKDPILGLVAGIQLSANNMLKLGDWLEMPKFGADGAVIDIGLTTVKVQNWDKTITTIPTYALVSDAFKNWSGMSDSGGRRIKRSIFIDTTSIHFLSEQEQNELIKAKLLKPYLTKRHHEIEEYNQSEQASSSILNQRRLTNIGTFRIYLSEYLLNHPRIRQDMTLMVRQLEPGAQGLPLEIYCFTNTVVWAEYEEIQADIFDHTFSIVEAFGLRVYQSPTGNDVRTLGQVISQDIRPNS